MVFNSRINSVVKDICMLHYNISKIKKSLIETRWLLVFIFFYIIFFFQYLYSLPYMDGAYDFLQSMNMYRYGMAGYIHSAPAVHTPLKSILFTVLFNLFGIGVMQYTILGLITGVLGIIGFYYLSKKLFNKEMSILVTLFFATSPLIFVNSIFSMRDVLITSFYLSSLAFYIRKKYLWYSIAATCAVFSKEPALLLPVAVCIVEAASFFHEKKSWKRLLLLDIPFMGVACWWVLLHANHIQSWDYVFNNKSRQSIYAIALYNLATFQFLNIIFYENILHLFFLNFNWVFWLIGLIGLSIYVRSNKNSPPASFQNIKTIAILLLFFIGFSLTVLSIPTYTITRYIIPLIPCMYLFAVWGVYQLKNYRYIFSPALIFLVLIHMLSMVASVDPVSVKLWGTEKLYDQTLYKLDTKLGGSDAVLYNLQLASIINKRSYIVLHTIPQTTQNCGGYQHSVSQRVNKVLGIHYKYLLLCKLQ